MKNKGRLYLVLIPIFLIVGILLTVTISMHRATQSAMQRAQAVLIDSAERQAETLETLIEGQYQLLEIFAAELSVLGSLDVNDIYDRAEIVSRNSGFSNVRFAAPDGTVYATDRQPVNISDREYFKISMGGGRGSEIVIGMLARTPLLMLSVPITKGDEIRGVIYGTYDESKLLALVTPRVYGGVGYSYVVDSDGNVIVGSTNANAMIEGDNLLMGLESAEFQKKGEIESIREALAGRESGSVSYAIDGEKRYMVYMPVNNERFRDADWFIFNVVPSSVIEEDAEAQRANGMTIISVLMIFVAASAVMLMRYESLNRLEISREADALEKTLRRVRLSEEEFRIAVLHSGKYVFRYDVLGRTLYAQADTAALRGIPDKISGMPDSMIELGFIAPESEGDIRDLFDRIHRGDESGSLVLRMREPQSAQWRWYHADFSAIDGADGEPQYAVLSLYDCTEQRERELAYEKWQQELAEMPKDKTTLIEWNLTKDEAERCEGEAAGIVTQSSEKALDAVMREYVANCVYEEDRRECEVMLSRERLIGAFINGVTRGGMDYRAGTGGGEYRWQRLDIQMVQYPNSKDIKLYLTIRDIDDKKRAEISMITKSEQDALTGVLNRAAFEAKARRLLTESENRTHAFIMLDMDGFKAVNDTFGHATGDKTLVEMIGDVRAALRYNDMIGRIGGDEFMICLRDAASDSVIEMKVKQLCQLLRRKLSPEITVSLSLGIAVYPRDGNTYEQLYRNADAALYYTKNNGKDGYTFYDKDISIRHPISGMGTGSGDDARRFIVLVADDSEADRKLYAGILRRDYNVIEASDGHGVLKHLRRYGSSISAVLMDFYMPDMHGYDVLVKMRENAVYAGVPVIVVSDEENRETNIESIRAGAVDFIIKPVDPDVLRIKVESAISRVENERLRAQNSFLKLRGAQEEQYRQVLSATGTVVMLYDWESGVFTCDSNISKYIFARFESRKTLEDYAREGVLDQSDAKELEALGRAVIAGEKPDNAVMNVRLRAPGGDMRWFKAQFIKMAGAHESSGKLLITLGDIDEEVRAVDRLRRMAEFDELTGLYTRAAFVERAGEMISGAEPGAYCIAYFDITRFKAINDTYGRETGDALLCGVADKLRACMKKGDIGCRIAGDRFAACVSDERWLADAYRSFSPAGAKDGAAPFEVIFSFGFYKTGDTSISADAMLDRAMIAQATIKNSYLKRYAYYTEDMRKTLLNEQEITGVMEDALKQGQFDIYLQPQYDHMTGSIVGAETLARWLRPTRSFVPPNAFIPIFEKNGFITRLDRYIWERACMQLRTWLDRGGAIPLSVNVSRYDVFDADFDRTIRGLVEKYGIPPELFRLEITETAFVNAPEQIAQAVRGLRESGFMIEIDDFGSGYSSLNTLKNLSADVLKLDMRFFERGADESGESRGDIIISSVTDMARRLGMSVIAEGVESKQQADFLCGIGCRCVQGYLYGKPMPIAEFEELLKTSAIDAGFSG